MAAIKKSQAIERWGAMRESTIEPFVFTPKNTILSFIFAGLVPYAIFCGLLGSQHERDAELGKAPKKYVGEL
eukprot:CFRG0992T1